MEASSNTTISVVWKLESDLSTILKSDLEVAD